MILRKTFYFWAGKLRRRAAKQARTHTAKLCSFAPQWMISEKSDEKDYGLEDP